MMNKIFIFVSCIVLIVSTTLYADNDSVIDWRVQVRKNFEKTDKELNRVYKLAIESIKNSENLSGNLATDTRKEWIEQQRKAQRAWIIFRDEDSKVIESSWYGGSGMGAAQWSWKQRLTEKRIDDLKEQYKLIGNTTPDFSGNCKRQGKK